MIIQRETVSTIEYKDHSIERLRQIKESDGELKHRLASNLVHVTFPPYNVEVALEKPVTGHDILRHELFHQVVQREIANTDQKNECLAIRQNQLITNLNSPVSFSQLEITPVMFYSVEGHEVYRRSLVFLFGMAVASCFPDLVATVEHVLPEGFFCEIQDMDGVDPGIVKQIEDKMKELVALDAPLTEERVPFDLALEYFSKTNRPFTSLLIMSNNEQAVPVDKCNDYCDMHHGPLVSSTGRIKHFVLKSFRHGMVIAFPPDPYSLQFNEHGFPNSLSIPDNVDASSDILVNIYREANNWGRITKLRCVGELNSHIREKKIKHFIALNHALHDSKISKIARSIAKNRNIKLILAAGPSSTGKTTFAKKLSIQLEILGLRPVILSVDDYYKSRADIPKDDQGKMDFEALDSLRSDLLNDHLLSLFAGEEIESPIFDFKLGTPLPVGRKMKLDAESVLIMEGIHCLNDALTPRVPDAQKCRIFLAPLTQLNLDEKTFVNSTTNRLLRRLVRDYSYRGYSAVDTLDRWPSVRRAEHKNIFPYVKNADFIVNTALDYEICVLKTYAKPLLKSILPSHPHFNQARELLQFLNNFHALGDDHIPSDSLIREFIGGSFFEE